MPAFMSDNIYKTNSLVWQGRRLQRQGSEWLQYQLGRVDIDLPDVPDWAWSEAVARAIFWTVVCGLSAWLLWLIYLMLEQPLREWWAKDRPWVKLGDRPPVPPESRSPYYWWTQALRLGQQGNYGDACRALYRATLQQLHDRQVLLHDLSRTDGEYLDGLSQRLEVATLPRPYQLVIVTHERLTFGGAVASAEIFSQCRSAYEEIAEE